MDYKKMIEDYAKNGGSEAKMWESVAITAEMFDYIKETNPEKYECFMRKQHEILYGKHYDESLAMYEVEKMHSTGADGTKRQGAYWTAEQIEKAMEGMTFPKGTTKWDKFVAFNAFAHDLGRKFDDAQILDAAYLFWFADEDWKSSGKVWDYMSANK